MKRSTLKANIDKILTKYPQEILQEELHSRTLPQRFYILMNVYGFYDSGGKERNNFQQLSELIELRFISTT